MDTPRESNKNKNYPNSDDASVVTPTDSGVSNKSSTKSKQVHIFGESDMDSQDTEFMKKSKFRTIRDSVIDINIMRTLRSVSSTDSIGYTSHSLFEFFINSLMLIFGNEPLAIPFAFAHAGWLIGIISSIIIYTGFGYCFYSCCNILKEVRNSENNQNLTFPDALAIALKKGPPYIRWLSRPSSHIVNVLNVLYRISTCALFSLFLAQNLAQVYQDVDVLWTVRIWQFLVFVPFLVIGLIPDLHRLGHFNVVSVIFQIIGFCLLIADLVKDLPPLSKREMSKPFEMYFIYCGIMGHSCGPTHTIALGLIWQHTDQSHKIYSRMSLIISVFSAALMGTLIGFLGYWKYGDDSLASVTLNLATHSEYHHWIRIIFVITNYTRFIVHVYIALNLIWHHSLKQQINQSRGCMLFYEYLIRITFVTVSSSIAIAIPRLGLLKALCGLFPNIIIGFIIVPLAEISLKWPNNFGRFKWNAIKNIIFVTVAILVLISGLIVNLRLLIHSLKIAGEEYDFLPCRPNSTLGTLKIYCNSTNAH